MACEFQCSGGEDRLNNFQATHLYRIAQEAVSNAIKHGRGRHIHISLECRGDLVSLIVSDDGVGIDMGLKKDGVGLRIMQYRAGLIDATLYIRRTEPTGTEVACHVLRPTIAGQDGPTD